MSINDGKAELENINKILIRKDIALYSSNDSRRLIDLINAFIYGSLADPHNIKADAFESEYAETCSGDSFLMEDRLHCFDSPH